MTMMNTDVAVSGDAFTAHPSAGVIAGEQAAPRPAD